MWLSILASASTGRAIDYPWIYLTPEKDSRDQEVSANDEADSRNMVEVINANEPLLHHRVQWKKVAIKDLLSMRVPFCVMHFDAVRPLWLSAEEKTILTEYFRRGGFILFFIDAYPYAQREFWKIAQWPLVDFIKSLPSVDSEFETGRATDEFPIFKIHYWTQTADGITHELRDNPNTPNRTTLSYRGRLCAFVMGRYYLMENDEWIPKPRPFSADYSMELKSYRLIVNIYLYAMAE